VECPETRSGARRSLVVLALSGALLLGGCFFFPNLPPEASFTASPTEGNAPLLVRFDASASRDPDGRIVSFAWDFGDGAIAAGASVQHVFTAPATYAVILTVANDDGTTDETRRSVVVAPGNFPPTASFTVSPSSPRAGDTVRFDGLGSSDSDGHLVSYIWTFGDGETAQGPSVAHRYARTGTYFVRLTVTDDGGATGSAARNVVVSDAPPDAGTISRHYEWSYLGIARSCDLFVPASLYQEYRSRLRGPWIQRDYDEYVLDPLDDSLLQTLANSIASTSGSDYSSVAECALAFVQATITYALDPGLFEYPRYPVETLVDLVGDCEDTAILYASLVRTLGQGALIVAVDTDRDGTADHMVTFVPVDQAYADAVSCPNGCAGSFWNYGGSLYALAETAVDGAYLPLGCDPWGLQEPDLKEIWDVSRRDLEPKVAKWIPGG